MAVKFNGCFFIESEELLKKHNDIWNKVRNSKKKEFEGVNLTPPSNFKKN